MPSASTTASAATWSIATPTWAWMPPCRRNIPQQRLAVRQPADAEVAEERLGGDVGELDLLVQTSLAQLIGGIEQELVRRAETARALRRGDHHIARIGEEAAPGLSGADRIRPA